MRHHIDRCVLEKFTEKHSNLTIFSVVEKSKINRTSLAQIYFNRTFDKEILEECHKIFTKRSCDVKFFSIEDKPVNLKNKTFSMYLYYPDHVIHENPHLTLHDLLLNNLLNYLSIFFGLNVSKLFTLLFELLKKLKLLRSPRLCKYFKISICLLGFAFHGYILLDNAMNGDLVQLETISRFSKMEMPNLIFCFEYDEEKIDPNRKLTYAYLDELTKDLNFSFFRRLTYLDEDYKMQEFRGEENVSLNSYQQNHQQLLLCWFYFLNLKCLEFKFKPIENNRFVYLLNRMQIAKIQFNKQVISKYYNFKDSFDFYFSNKNTTSLELNGINKLTMQVNDTGDSKQLFSIVSNLVVFRQKDLFTFVKEPLSLLLKTVNLNDTTEYIEALKSGFSRLSLKTKKVPLFFRKENMDQTNLEIDVSGPV